VVVLGGGDTGADCVATAHRQGARQVVQISINPRLPEQRAAGNPWPEDSLTYARTYALEEGGVEEFGVNIVAFRDDDSDGRVDRLLAERVDWTYDRQGRRVDKQVLEPDISIPAELVLVAIGFQGARADGLLGGGLDLSSRGTLATDRHMMTGVPGVFAAGDAHMGQSIVVWAIGEGRDVARRVDTFLTGQSRLPSGLESANPLIGRRKRPVPCNRPVTGSLRRDTDTT
jgi:glutamate synthase (NADPH/NADH) small chain